VHLQSVFLQECELIAILIIILIVHNCKSPKAEYLIPYIAGMFGGEKFGKFGK